MSSSQDWAPLPLDAMGIPGMTRTVALIVGMYRLYVSRGDQVADAEQSCRHALAALRIEAGSDGVERCMAAVRKRLVIAGFSPQAIVTWTEELVT
jgi:hypothetical protein